MGSAAPWEAKGSGDNQYSRRGELVRGMMMAQPKGTLNPPLAADDPSAQLVYAIALAGDDRKARAISAIRVSALTTVTSFVVTMTGKSKTQVSAIGSNVRDEVKKGTGRDVIPQGNPASGWVVLDYGDAIVHVFTPETKNFYELDKLWKNGQPLALEGVVTPEGLSELTEEEEADSLLPDVPSDDQIWDDDDADIWG